MGPFLPRNSHKQPPLRMLLRCFLRTPSFLLYKMLSLPSARCPWILLTVPIPGPLVSSSDTPEPPPPRPLQFRVLHLPHYTHLRSQGHPPFSTPPNWSFCSQALPHMLLGHVLGTPFVQPRTCQGSPKFPPEPGGHTPSSWTPQEPPVMPGVRPQPSFGSLRPHTANRTPGPRLRNFLSVLRPSPGWNALAREGPKPPPRRSPSASTSRPRRVGRGWASLSPRRDFAQSHTSPSNNFS